MLPKVCAPSTRMPRLLRCRCNCCAKRSPRFARMQASQTELRSTSSMQSSSMLPTKAIVRSMSAGLALRWMLLSRIDKVTLLGCTPQAFISSMRTQTPSLFVLIVASISSLKVTALGAKPPPIDRIFSMTARACLTCPCCKCFLMIVLYVTTSAMLAATASAMIRSAASMSWQSMQASKRVLYRQGVFSGHAWKTAVASARRRSPAKLLMRPTTFGDSTADFSICSITSGRLRRRAASATMRPVRTSAKMSSPPKFFS
mmetsp:Transcript_1412/g.4575  ORF Transcript_1412/g.4575 Transcript_1412/m.4575 type:complete len:258 (-) Transcript_1412:707-1480(-)